MATSIWCLRNNELFRAYSCGTDDSVANLGSGSIACSAQLRQRPGNRRSPGRADLRRARKTIGKEACLALVVGYPWLLELTGTDLSADCSEKLGSVVEIFEVSAEAKGGSLPLLCFKYSHAFSEL